MHKRSVVSLWLAVDKQMQCNCLLKWRYENQSFYYTFSLLIYLQFPLITIINYFQLSFQYLKMQFFSPQFILFVQSCGLVPNTHVYSALISQAVKRLDYAYLHELLLHMHNLQVPPNDVIIRQLEFAAEYPPSYDKVRN